MPAIPRFAALFLTPIVLAGALAACSAPSPAPTGSAGAASTAAEPGPSATPAEGCRPPDGDAPVPLDGLPADADASGGLTSGSLAPGPGGQIVTAAFQAVPVMDWPPVPPVPVMRSGQLPDCALALLAETAAELAPLVSALDGDLGTPPVTDQPTTVIEYLGPPAMTVFAYGLEFAGDAESIGLSPDQARARELMRQLSATVVEYTGSQRDIQPVRLQAYGATDFCWTTTDPEEIADLIADAEAGTSGTAVRTLAPGLPGCAEL